MILSVHMLAGAAIGSKIKNYWAIFFLAMASHFILDAIPHWEYAVQLMDVTDFDFLIITLKASVDLVAGAAIIHFILRSSNLLRPALLGAFFGLLPDGLNFLYFLLKLTFKWNIAPLYYFMAFHDRIHFTDKADFLFWRIAAEAVIAAVSLFVLWKTRSATK